MGWSINVKCGCPCWTLFGKSSQQSAILGRCPKIFPRARHSNDNSLFADEKVLSKFHYIDFKKIVTHDWEKLWEMRKHLNSEYKAVLSFFLWQVLISQTSLSFVLVIMKFTCEIIWNPIQIYWQHWLLICLTKSLSKAATNLPWQSALQHNEMKSVNYKQAIWKWGF